MCGIYCSISDGDVRRPVLDGLQRLEYRGYDSAGVAWMSDERLRVIKSVGRIQRLVTKVSREDISAQLMLGHTRWATHGKCTEENAHPHISNGELALVHNGIIENYLELEVELQSLGYTFVSSTDTEVLAHLLHHCLQSHTDPQRAIEECLKRIEGNYAFVVCFRAEPQRLFGVCNGSPLVVGLDKDALYLSSDIAALTPVTSQVIYLEDGNVFVGNLREYGLFDFDGGVLEARITETKLSKQILDLGVYHNYTEKEIFEQPQAAIDTIKARVTDDGIIDDLCGVGSDDRLRDIEEVHIVGCGSSYHAGLVAQHWFEDVARVPCRVDIASEFTSRPVVGRGRRLLLLVSQSGETADTINALRAAGAAGYFMTLCIVNVAKSALTRMCEFSLHTHAGPEVGVATTKALTTQMICLLMLATRMAQLRLGDDVGVGAGVADAGAGDGAGVADAGAGDGASAGKGAGDGAGGAGGAGVAGSGVGASVTSGGRTRADAEAAIRTAVSGLLELPNQISRALKLDNEIIALCTEVSSKQNVIFLGKGVHFPVAMEGSLKLKEISYIHAEAYPAGELKHGPLALVDYRMSVIAVAPNNTLLSKLKNNLNEVRARHGRLIVFADQEVTFEKKPEDEIIIYVSAPNRLTSPIVHIIPLQLLAYHVSMNLGVDVDKPRNLAKSVTVE